MNKIVSLKAVAAVVLLASAATAQAASVYAYRNWTGTFDVDAQEGYSFSDNNLLLRGLTNRSSFVVDGSSPALYASQSFVQGTFTFDPSDNVADANTFLGSQFNGVVSNFTYATFPFENDLPEDNDTPYKQASFGVGGAIVGNQTLNGNDLLSVGGNAFESSAWSGFDTNRTISGVNGQYTLTSISLNYIGDANNDFVGAAQSLPGVLPVAGYKDLALQLIFTNKLDPSDFTQYQVGTFVTVECISGDCLNPPPAVPVPAAAWLMGSGLIGLAGLARRRRV
jgi:hypothetical protein